MNVIEAVRWAPDRDAVRIIDQTLLPERFEERDLRSLDEVCDAIARLCVRGAPAIGVAGAMGLVASLLPFAGEAWPAFARRLREHAERIERVRPTAVNLSWAIGRMREAAWRAEAAQGGAREGGSGGSGSGEGSGGAGSGGAGEFGAGAPPRNQSRAASPAEPNRADADRHRSTRDPRAVLDAMRAEATRILDEDRDMCRRIGEHGLALVPDGARVLTHCNAGALATGGMGTALAPLYLAAQAGRRIEVFADETRPLLQGSRLTAWELSRAGIPVTVLADNMAASLMRAGRIDLVIVGADRIAANGDVANKIGTYGVAVLARHHGIPFYVAAPTSTFDAALPSGDAIEIEQRARDEMARPFGRAAVPDGVPVCNPAFDVTPAGLVTAIVSDRGVHRAPYDFRAAPFGVEGQRHASAPREPVSLA